MVEARQWLTGKDLAEFKWDINEYIKHEKEAMFNPDFVKQLENASARFHISKLEALKIKTQNAIEQLYGKTAGKTNSLFGQIYADNYYHTAFNLQQGFNDGRRPYQRRSEAPYLVGWDIAALNPHQIESVLSKPWTLDKKTFSDRLWSQKQSLLDEVHTQLTQNLMLGKPPDEAIFAIAKKSNTSKQNAGRLIMTESAYFSNEAQKDAFNSLDVEEFEVVGTLDGETCGICGGLDGSHFPMSQYKTGVTAPYFSDNGNDGRRPYLGERFAREVRPSAGKTYYVPSDMTYNEWKEKYVVENTSVSGVGESSNDDKNTYLIPIDNNVDILSISDSLEANKNIFNKANDAGITITISRKNSENIYPELNENEINYVMAAHKTVLEHGLKNKTEMFLAFDRNTGQIILQKVGSKDKVTFEHDKRKRINKNVTSKTS